VTPPITLNVAAGSRPGSNTQPPPPTVAPATTATPDVEQLANQLTLDDFFTSMNDCIRDSISTAIEPVRKDIQELRTELLARIADLETRLAQAQQEAQAARQEAQAARQTATEALETATTAQNQMTWMASFMADQFHAAQKLHTTKTERQVVLRPTPEFQNGKVGFGQLTEAVLDTTLGLSPTEASIIVEKYTRLENGMITKHAQDQPCEFMVVELRTLDIKRRVLSKNNRDMVQTNHQIRIFDHLLENEIREKQHLQATAMEHLRNHGFKATWRRSRVTWFVEAKNNFALLSGFEIPVNATEQQVLEAAARAEGHTRLREQRSRHTTNTTNLGTNHTGSRPGSSAAAMAVDGPA
jgi:hypothetical protein